MDSELNWIQVDFNIYIDIYRFSGFKNILCINKKCIHKITEYKWIAIILKGFFFLNIREIIEIY